MWILSFSWQLRSCCRLLKPTTAATPQADSTNVHTHTFISSVFLLQRYCDNVPDVIYHLASNVIAEVSWSEAEKRLLVKSLQLHQKDFSRIQKAVRFLRVEASSRFCRRVHMFLCAQVQTKSVSECVEFYYLWKKKMNASSRGLTINRETCFNISVQQSKVDQWLDSKFCSAVEFLYR